MVPCFDCDIDQNSRRLVVEKADLGTPSDGGTTLGRARLSGHIPHDPRGDLYLKIQLNSSVFNNPTFEGGTDADLWAGVIAHEILHNFQYNHGDSGNFDADYPGYFIYEFGVCITSYYENLTRQLYGQILGMEPDPDGLRDNVNAMRQHGFEWVRAGMAGSQESRNNINNLYRQYLCRDAEPGGMDHHINLLASGQMTLDQIRNGIANSAEAQQPDNQCH